MATAMLVICSFIMLSVAFIILGRSYLITEYREKMDRNADEVSRTASALSVDGNVSSWNLRLVITSISTSSGNHIFITNPEGTIVLCSDREYYCEHMGQQMSRNVMELLQSEGGIDQLSNLDGFYSGTRFVVAKPIDDPSGNRLRVPAVFRSSLLIRQLYAQVPSPGSSAWRTRSRHPFGICLGRDEGWHG